MRVQNYDDAVSVERMHKRLDQHTMAGVVADGVYSLLDIDRLPAALARHARATRPLCIELSKTACERYRQRFDPQTTHSAGDVRGLLESRLAKSRNVVAIVGSLAKRRDWMSLIDALEIPVFTTVQAKGTIDERKPNAAGIYTGAGQTLALETTLVPRPIWS